MKKSLIFILFLATTTIFAQYGRKDSNRIGLSGGITQLSLNSDNFNATDGTGFIGGFSVRGNYYNNWQMIFGMNFIDTKFSLKSTANEDVDFKLSGVQVYLLGSYMVVENHLTLEIGPVLQVNGELKANNEEAYLKDRPLLQAKDITDITKINGNAYIGITAGLKNLRLNVNYQYGFTNILNNLNKKDELKVKNNNQEFKGNIGMLSAMLTIYL